MEYLELESLTEEKVTYRYYPEGGKEFGVVSLVRKTEEVIHDKLYPDITKMYVRQAISCMYDFNKANNFPEHKHVMWY